MADTPISQAVVIAGQFVQSVAITKSDDTVYDPPLKGLFIGGAGNAGLMLQGDTAAQTWTGFTAGYLLTGVLIKKVMSANTTASLMIGLR